MADPSRLVKNAASPGRARTARRVSPLLPAALVLLLLRCSAPPTGGAPAPAPRAPRLVLLYAPCSVNADFLSVYNRSVDFTPRLQGFSEHGTVFRRHWTEAGLSGIAYAAILSGAQATRHGVLAHPSRLSDSLHLISEVFADHGFETFAWDGHRLASAAHNYFQGVSRESAFGQPLDASSPVFQAVLRRLATEPDLRVFIATTFIMNHVPYSTKYVAGFCRDYPQHCSEWKDRQEDFDRYAALHHEHYKDFAIHFSRTVEALHLSDTEVRDLAAVTELLYRSTIRELDLRFGAVLDRIREAGLSSESLIVFTADHGEVPFRHNALFKWSHGWELAPEDLRTPLILGGGATSGLRPTYEGVSRSIDVLPTVASLANVRGPRPSEDRETEGVDLSDALRGIVSPPELVAFSHTGLKHEAAFQKEDASSRWMLFHSQIESGQMWVSMVDGHRHFKFRNLDGTHWGFQMFDLAADPAEEHDRFNDRDPEHRAAARRLLAYQGRLRRAWVSTLPGMKVPDGALEELRSLGYVK